jgi:hypothetical protein
MRDGCVRTIPQPLHRWRIARLERPRRFDQARPVPLRSTHTRPHDPVRLKAEPLRLRSGLLPANFRQVRRVFELPDHRGAS